MKYLTLIPLIVLFSACGGGSAGTSTTSEPSYVTDDLYYQQWYMEENSTFYSQNSIDSNAHIQANGNLSNYTGKGIKVAVIDNGFDVEHPQIKDKIIATVSVDTYGNILGSDVSHNPTSEYHGTAVAGIIASADDNVGIRGVSPEVELILIKSPSSITAAGEIELFNQAINYGADVINCSWGTGSVSSSVENYINGIANTGRDGKGAIIVFASGNDNADVGNDEASIENVIAVGATGEDNLRTSYSSYGKVLDIVAPGGSSLGIATLDPLGSNGANSDEYIRYNETNNGSNVYFTGTSASAPILSGTIALLLQKDSNLTRLEIQEKLKYSTDTIGLNTPYLDEMVRSSSQTPTITGLLGTSGNSDIKVRLTLDSNSSQYGPYNISVNGDNTFSSSVTDTLPEGNYTIELLNNALSTVYATDSNFEVNTSKTDESNSSIRKSDFYGYGKINLGKLLQ